MVKYIFSLLCLLCFISQPLCAAQVNAVADRDRIGLGESLNLQLRVDGKPDDDPDLSVVKKNWDILNQSSSSQTQIINGNFSRSRVVSLTLMPKTSGTVDIPAICFGQDCSMPVTIQVSEQQATATKGDEVRLETEVQPQTVMVGQQVLLTIRVLHRVNLAGAGLDNIEPQGVDTDIEQLGEDRSFETRRDGYLYKAIERRYALFPNEAGQLIIPRLTLQAQVPDNGGFSSFSSRTRTLRRFSAPLTVAVQPQPADQNGRLWLPATAVTVSDSWQQQAPKFRVGEPVTRTLTLQVKGLPAAHLPDLKLPLPSHWKSYPDQPVRADSNDDSGRIGTLQQKIAVVPTEAGTMKLPGFDLDWYDVVSQQWQVAKIPAMSVTVAPAAPGTVAQQPPAVQPQVPVSPQQQQAPASTSPQVEVKNSTVVVPDQGHSPWLWVSAALAACWLLTLALWWRQSRHQRQAQQELQDAAQNQAAGREKDAFKQLMKILRQHNPQASRQALLEWGRCRWPEIGHNLERLAGHLDPELTREIEQLSEALYTHKDIAWQGDAMAEKLQRWRQLKENKSSQVQLPGLYPERS